MRWVGTSRRRRTSWRAYETSMNKLKGSDIYIYISLELVDKISCNLIYIIIY
jgi:hypothetical protein